MIIDFVNNLLLKTGYKIIYQGNDAKNTPRNSQKGCLNQINNIINIQSIIDVGAAFGSFSSTANQFFPKADFYLFEPLKQYNQSLNSLKKSISSIEFKNLILSDKRGKVDFFLHEDLVGSSLKHEVEGKYVDGKKISLQSDTLDNQYKLDKFKKNILLKIDVQGAELDVLKGGLNTLKNSEVVILETSFLKSMINGYEIFDTISFMKKYGFVVYDIYGFLYRPYDNALSQSDMVFVKEKSIFRKFQGFATKKQRQIQFLKFQNLNNF